MSATKIVTEERIVSCALEIVRGGGMEALNARSLAKKLGCSTRPVYISFGGMKGVKQAVSKRITEIFQSYLKAEADSGKYPEYKAYGMAYVKFASRESKLFSYMFMRNRPDQSDEVDVGDISRVLSALGGSTGLEGDAREKFHAEVWIFTHGIAAMQATGFLKLDEEAVSELLTDMFLGLKSRLNI